MLLRNDSMLGGEADTNEEAARLFQTLSDHYGILKEHFNLERILQAQAASASVPATFKKGMGSLLEHYLAIQKSLAGDDFLRAKNAGEKFSSALKEMDADLLKGEARSIWMKALERLREGSDKITAAKDIEMLRRGFESLSIGMSAAVDRLGVATEGPVYELYCPMAIDSKGAIWLQHNQEVLNPYFGAQMLNCGEVKRQLKGKTS
jgi:Cu(I)/Ag(I) efflux system membrane fusion protein